MFAPYPQLTPTETTHVVRCLEPDGQEATNYIFFLKIIHISIRKARTNKTRKKPGKCNRDQREKTGSKDVGKYTSLKGRVDLFSTNVNYILTSVKT
jgi:hypothetical protein